VEIVSSPHLRPIVEVALLTGMRRGELLGLKWEQIRNGFIYLTETKSNKSRQIPINDRLAEVFKEVAPGKAAKIPLHLLRFPGKAVL
jgi:integrase